MEFGVSIIIVSSNFALMIQTAQWTRNLHKRHSGKSWSKNKFNHQVLDFKWKSVCQYTRAPLLECIFSICCSIKSFVELDELHHRAILCCPCGQHNTGILIACFLKYMKKFDFTHLAYDYYCSKRWDKLLKTYASLQKSWILLHFSFGSSDWREIWAIH